MYRLLEYGWVVSLVKECWRQVVNILDADDDTRLGLIDPVMAHQAQLVLDNNNNVQIKQNYLNNKNLEIKS